jgi:N-acetylglutamate synthase-like GNAT family acetyltransferase
METMNQNVLNDFTKVLIKTKYKSIIKELKLEHCTDDSISLNVLRIKDSQQNKGYGNAVMSDIVQLADEHNVRIKLFATNLWGAELKRLYGFYEKHGFVLIKTEGINIGTMVYYPKKKRKKCNLSLSMSV